MNDDLRQRLRPASSWRSEGPRKPTNLVGFGRSFGAPQDDIAAAPPFVIRLFVIDSSFGFRHSSLIRISGFGILSTGRRRSVTSSPPRIFRRP